MDVSNLRTHRRFIIPIYIGLYFVKLSVFVCRQESMSECMSASNYTVPMNVCSLLAAADILVFVVCMVQSV